MANEAELAIYNRLALAPTFHPASTDLFANDWVLETGDIITVQSGQDSYSVPIYSMSLEWKGSCKVAVESTGNEKREPLSALKRQQYGGGSSTYTELKRFTAELQQFEDDMGAQIGLVVQEVSGEFVVNSASIVAAINAAGSTVNIDADKIYLNGQTIVKDNNGLIAPNGWFTDLYAGSGTGAFVVEGQNINAYSKIIAEGGLDALDGATVNASFIKAGSLNVLDGSTERTATWQSKTVVTSVGVTLPSITRSTERHFLYAADGQSHTPNGSAQGSLVTGYSDGSVSPTTETIYYLGRTQSNA